MWRTVHFSCLLVIVCAMTTSGLEFNLEHSVDSGKSWSQIGTIEGDAKTGLVLARKEPSTATLEQLQALAESDGFYKVRVGSTVASVRASCFLAAGVEEQLVLALEGKDVLGVAYQVQSPACSKKASGGGVSLPSRELPVVMQQATIGPVLNAHIPDAGMFVNVDMGSMGMDASAGSSQQQRGGAASRPMGVAPGSAGAATSGAAAGKEEPPPEQSWLQKNWMFVLGGVMVVFNVMANGAKVQQPQQGAAAGARRG